MSHANKRTFLECHFGLFVVLATGMLQFHVYVNTHVKNGEECKVGVIARDVLCLRRRQMHTDRLCPCIEADIEAKWRSHLERQCMFYKKTRINAR